jgi:peptidoglycan/xylan/chitin deacetylase (PgdA/CDA1 family)
MIALTFDDGPGAYTDRLLDIFQQHGGKATFFLMGNKIDKRPETVQRMAAEGHEIGGHSWSHKELTKLTDKEIRSQLVKVNNKINELTGLKPAIMRPPYGSYNDDVRAVAKKLGLSAINWNVDTLDWKYKDAEYVCKAAKKKLKDGNIILFHDIHPTTVDAMELIVPELIEEGYQLVTVSQLLTADGGKLVPGKIYYNKK